MHKERILALADVIEELEFDPRFSKEKAVEKAFGMNNYQYSCGSPSCIAGWAGHLGRLEGFEFETSGSFAKGAEYLELSDSVADNLFLAPGSRYELDSLTPAAAAWVLRNLTVTGKVAWTKAMKETSHAATR